MRAKMEGRALVRDRLGALALYEKWRKRIAEELGAVPAPEIADLAARLQRGEYTPIHTGETAKNDATSSRATLRGRTAQFERLYEKWHQACHGNATHTLLSGHAGIGKSALAAQFASIAHAEGALAVIVYSYAIERANPFTMLRRMVGALCNQRGASGAPGDSLASLSKICPEIPARYPALRPEDTPGRDSPVDLGRATSDLIAAIADERPLVIVLDDIDDCDDDSLAVLEAALLQVLGKPMMVIGCTRSRTRSHLLRQMAHATYQVETVDLEPLGAGDLCAVVHELLQDSHPRLSPLIVRALVTTAAGNPRMARLLSDDWKRRAGDCLALQLDGVCERLDLPSGRTGTYIRETRSTLERLDPVTRHVAHVLATLAERTVQDSTTNFVDLSHHELAQSLTTLRTAGIITDGADAGGFANNLIRAAAYLDAPLAVRRTLHRMANSVLAPVGTRMTPVAKLRAAHHLARAGDIATASSCLLDAATEALESGDIHAAEFALSTGADVVACQNEQRRASILLAQCLNHQARWAESHELLAGLTTTEPGIEQMAIAALRHAANRRLLPPSHPGITESFAALEQSLADASAIQPPGIVAYIHSSHVARRALDNAQPAPPVPVSRVQQLAQRRNADELLGDAIVLYGQRRLSECTAILNRCAEVIGRARPRHPLWMPIRFGMSCVEIAHGRYLRGEQHLLLLADMSRELGNIDYEATAAISLTRAYARLGRIGEQAAWADRALVLAGDRLDLYVEEAVYFKGLGHHRAGCRHDTYRAVETLDRLAEGLSGTTREFYCATYAADLLWMRGARKAALQRVVPHLLGISIGTINRGILGDLARWLALALREGELSTSMIWKLEELCALTPQMDTLDRVMLAHSCRADRFALEQDPIELERECLKATSHLPASALYVMNSTLGRA